MLLLYIAIFVWYDNLLLRRTLKLFSEKLVLVGIELFKVNNGNAGTVSNLFKDSNKNTRRGHWHRSSFFIFNFEQISGMELVFPLFYIAQ